MKLARIAFNYTLPDDFDLDNASIEDVLVSIIEHRKKPKDSKPKKHPALKSGILFFDDLWNVHMENYPETKLTVFVQLLETDESGQGWIEKPPTDYAKLENETHNSKEN